jgi:hypothetical protein
MIIYLHVWWWSTTTVTCIAQYNKLIDLLIYWIQLLIIYNRINVLCDGIKTPKCRRVSWTWEDQNWGPERTNRGKKKENRILRALVQVLLPLSAPPPSLLGLLLYSEDWGIRFLFQGTSCFYPEDGGTKFLKTLVPVYQTAHCHIPEDNNFDTHHHENLKIFL